MNFTNQLGEITELRCRLDFIKRGIVLSQPTNPSSRYDFIADINNELIRIQCKTCHLEENNRISFPVSSKNYNTGEKHNYINEIDFFYTNWNYKGYLIPIEICSESSRTKILRLDKPENYHSNNAKALYAKDFEIDVILSNSYPDFNYEIIDIETEDRKIIRKKSENYFCIECGKPIQKFGSKCLECYKKSIQPEDMPSREELKQMIRTLPFTEIGFLYHRSDNAIRKWCDKYNLPRKKTEINNLNDDEWDKI